MPAIVPQGNSNVSNTTATKPVVSAQQGAKAIVDKGRQAYSNLTLEERESATVNRGKVAFLYPFYSPNVKETKGKGNGGYKVLGFVFKNVSKEPVPLILGAFKDFKKKHGYIIPAFGSKAQKYMLQPGEEIALSKVETVANFMAAGFLGQVEGKSESGLGMRISISNKFIEGTKFPTMTPVLFSLEEGKEVPRLYEIYKPMAKQTGEKSYQALPLFKRYEGVLKTNTVKSITGVKSTGDQVSMYQALGFQNDLAALLNQE